MRIKIRAVISRGGFKSRWALGYIPMRSPYLVPQCELIPCSRLSIVYIVILMLVIEIFNEKKHCSAGKICEIKIMRNC